ncbi:hypothetical protein DOY81_006869 [Sarcophaga bullata]|nr:hypothetical protein DOY81_006869 [Sarcophaga bullata]
MKSFERILLNLIFIGLATQSVVEGLQCYVCEDCNEYEDFKELHICGEIPVVGTVQPAVTLPELITQDKTTKKPVKKPTPKPTVKPELPVDSDEYAYEDSDEIGKQKKTTKAPIIKTHTATESTVAVMSSVNTENKSTKKPATLASVGTTAKPPLETTNKVQETTTEPPSKSSSTTTSTTNTTTTATTTTTTTTTTNATTKATTFKPKPDQLPDYDDYLEYEDPIVERRSAKSLLKINEPVCYMIKYRANNTVFTNRGCTTFINSNKYLTCQSLYNGAPMESCRICSENGCNKFLSDDSDEADQGLLFNGSDCLRNFDVILISLTALFVRVILSVSF